VGKGRGCFFDGADFVNKMQILLKSPCKSPLLMGIGEGVNFDTQKSKKKLFENFTKHCCFFILFAAYQLRESSSAIHKKSERLVSQ